jgi:hypothetical protein
MELVHIFELFMITKQNDEIRSPVPSPPAVEYVSDHAKTPHQENGEDERTNGDMVVMRRRVKKRRNSKRLSIINGHLYDAEVK